MAVLWDAMLPQGDVVGVVMYEDYALNMSRLHCGYGGCSGSDVDIEYTQSVESEQIKL